MLKGCYDSWVPKSSPNRHILSLIYKLGSRRRSITLINGGDVVVTNETAVFVIVLLKFFQREDREKKIARHSAR